MTIQSTAIMSYAPPQTTHEFARAIAEKKSTKELRSFWQEHIFPIKLCHGTTSLYYTHFKKFGISATYPAPLENIVAKIRNVWTKHEHDICRKTGYFRDFEKRYDKARSKKEIAVSFSADPSITQEYTTGARHGGEWIREIRQFLYQASEKKALLSSEEQKTVKEMQSLVDLMGEVFPMIVKISAASPYASDARVYINFDYITPFEDFVATVKKEYPEWVKVGKLSTYLETTLLPKVKKANKEISKEYEYPIWHAVPPEELEFEFVGKPKIEKAQPRQTYERGFFSLIKKLLWPSTKIYPQIAFNTPTKLSTDEVIKLRIRTTSGFSAIEEYQDSIFDCNFDCSCNTWTITRKKPTQEDERSQLRKQWIQAFDCEKMLKE
jgi:hypothetical protein